MGCWGRAQGPHTESSLKLLAREGKISSGTLLWHSGLEAWEPLAKLQPEMAEQMNISAASLPVAGKTDRIPLLIPKSQQDKGVIKRIFGWGKK
ncbi:MAG: DUF4339 domain-containing protein [Verrucomicrobia bacterium]|nr:DUF4339 domain-containing protein [Verrucomicrobiota bacterium]